MTDHPLPHHSTPPHRTAHGVVWLFASLAVGVLGWLLFAVSDHGLERAAGLVLLAAALVGLVTTALVLRGRAPSSLAPAASALFAVAGVAAAVLVGAAGDTTFVVDVLLVGGLPVLAAVVTFVMGRRRRA